MNASFVLLYMPLSVSSEMSIIGIGFVTCNVLDIFLFLLIWYLRNLDFINHFMFFFCCYVISSGDISLPLRDGK